MTNTPISAPMASPASGSRVKRTDADYTAFKAIRDKIPCVLPDLDHAIKASTVEALDGIPYPIVFRNQGALDEWRKLYNSSRWGRHIWHRLSDAASPYIECMHEVHWQFEQHAGPCPRHEDPANLFDLLRSHAIQWAANIHYECKRGTLIETTAALDTLLLHSDLDDTLPMRFSHLRTLRSTSGLTAKSPTSLRPRTTRRIADGSTASSVFSRRRARQRHRAKATPFSNS